MRTRDLARAAFLVALAAGVAADTGVNPVGKIDDWQYAGGEEEIPGEPLKLAGGYAAAGMMGKTHRFVGTALTASPASLAVPAVIYLAQGSLADYSSASAAERLGYATGGAKDINNFRDNIENGYLPLASDMSYEGLFYGYRFETGQEKECRSLFCPSYSRAVSEDPLSNETEYFTTVGLNSNLERGEFERKKLNLVVVMDISGSMSSSFNQYYYDRYGNRREVRNATEKSKMEVAKESLQGLTEHLRPGDRVGVVLFNDRAYRAKPVNDVEDVDMEAIRGHIAELSSGGGTDMEAGMREASGMLEKYEDADPSEYENRIVFMTDAMPNTGLTTDDGLLNMTEDNAEDGIHTSFVGMGVDFNTELIDRITSIRGANYFSVHSSSQFRNRMDRDFKYMVTPLVYNLTLRMESDSYSIEKVYGSTAAEESTGRLLKVNTLFPSPTSGGKTRGGVVLVKLEGSGSGPVTLETRYEDREGDVGRTTETITLGERDPEYFENTGVRKAVVLSRYGELMKDWIRSEREETPGEDSNPRLEEQERQSHPLVISERYRERMNRFREHLRRQKRATGDESLQQEIEMIDQVLEQTE